MAKKAKKPDKADTSVSTDVAKPSGKGMNWQTLVLIIGFLACALAFLPTTLIFFFGMMPTFAALVIDHTPDRIKTLTVACMNVAGCSPFLIALWVSGDSHSLETALRIVGNSEALITIYGCAGLGYVIFYAIGGFVSSILLQSGKSRFDEVKRRMAELERKWGREVTGALPLDERGFADDSYADGQS